MSNGTGNEWAAIDELRRLAASNQERVVVLENRMTAAEAGLVAAEKRLSDHMDDLELAITSRLDRTRNTALALLAIAVPIISGLVGALISGGGS